MISVLIGIFLLGYVFITLEHEVGLSKSASALITGALMWAVGSFIAGNPESLNEGLAHHLSDIAQILFFLMGAMTIVELIDAHHGFDLVAGTVATDRPTKLLWIVTALSFLLAAVLDNLAASIVMVSLCRKLIRNPELRLLMAGVIVLAANAGGLWSPIGSITTTMLWIGGQISAGKTMLLLILPAVVNILVPVAILSFKLGKNIERVQRAAVHKEDMAIAPSERNTMLAVGLGALLLVPVFKMVTHLPPYVGMLFSLSLVWITSEIIHKNRDTDEKARYSVGYALSRIDSAGILFFLGILLAVACLEQFHLLNTAATALNNAFDGEMSLMALTIGLLSAVVDNVPLVAASMGMFSLTDFPQDHAFWHLIAYCAGTGGSILIIGSAAGVAVMGIEQIRFGWYMKRFSLLAFIGYIAGALVLLSISQFIS